jgi:hypothetical protein
MTEKSLSFEVHPMRGHSHGEWYGTLDNVVENDEDAEYWAVFGITHRGNKHCLAEYPTKADALAATQNFNMFPVAKRSRFASGDSGRKIVQLEVFPSTDSTPMIEIIALCSDGTVWHRGIGQGRSSGYADGSWEEITPDGLDGD